MRNFIILGAVGVILLTIVARFSVLRGHSSISTDYAGTLWASLAIGDTSSSQCEQIANQVKSEELKQFVYDTQSAPTQIPQVDSPTIEDHFYSYTKHRCIGYFMQNLYVQLATTSSLTNGRDSIVDLATGQSLATCDESLIKEDYGSVDCYDNKSHWSIATNTPAWFEKESATPWRISNTFPQLKRLAQD
jgi:hypothetical protein